MTIDVQNDFVLPGAPATVAGTFDLLAVIGRVVADFRARAVPVIHVVRLYRADGSNAELMTTATITPISLELARLEEMAKSGYYNPYTAFEWSESLSDDQPWMSEDLVTLAGTPMWDELTREQQLALTRYEAVNFFSLNVHGIRELLGEVVLRIHIRVYADASDFLHHFIGEKNEHMWFFSTFCRGPDPCSESRPRC